MPVPVRFSDSRTIPQLCNPCIHNAIFRTSRQPFHNFLPLFHIELFKDMRHMFFHSRFADIQLQCNLFIAQSLARLYRDLRLSPGKPQFEETLESLLRRPRFLILLFSPVSDFLPRRRPMRSICRSHTKGDAYLMQCRA